MHANNYDETMTDHVPMNDNFRHANDDVAMTVGEFLQEIVKRRIWYRSQLSEKRRLSFEDRRYWSDLLVRLNRLEQECIERYFS